MNEQIRDKKRVATISSLVGFIMFYVKISAYILTGSTAILSDALESIVHIIAASLAFLVCLYFFVLLMNPIPMVMVKLNTFWRDSKVV